ncbi:MAG: outer membrane beta-barrel protein [Bryobacteraceae bacterium]|jgi:hypothetical protein
MIRSNPVSRFALCAWLLPATCLFAADNSTPAPRRLELGVRIGLAPMSLFDTSAATASTTAPVASYAYTASSNSSTLDAAPTVAYRFSDRFSLGFEPRFHRAQYVQTTKLLSGREDPNAIYDDRIPSTITDTTRADYFEAPIVARYLGLGSAKLLSKAYVAGGLDIRYVGRVRTANNFAWADGSTDSNQTTDPVNSSNQIGWVAGVGLRFVDQQTDIKVTPEIRFVRWMGTTLQGPAYRSAANQLEIGIGISY